MRNSYNSVGSRSVLKGGNVSPLSIPFAATCIVTRTSCLSNFGATVVNFRTSAPSRTLPGSTPSRPPLIGVWSQVVCRADLSNYLVKELEEPKTGQQKRMWEENSPNDCFGPWGWLPPPPLPGHRGTASQWDTRRWPPTSRPCLQGIWRWAWGDPPQEQRSSPGHPVDPPATTLIPLPCQLLNCLFNAFSCVQFVIHGHVFTSFK